MSRHLRKAGAVFGVWTTIAFLFAGQWYLYDSTHGINDGFLAELRWALVIWYLWALLTPLVLAVTRRFRFTRESWPRVLAAHTAYGLFFALIQLTLVVVFTRMVVPPTITFGAQLGREIIKLIHINVLTYAAIVGAIHAVWQLGESRQREVDAAELRVALVDAQVRALRSQLQPHFLFNTLHAIATVIHEAPDDAEEMTQQLSELLRMSIDEMDVQYVPFRRELEFLGCYLGIEERRFKDRLSVDYAVASGTLELAVPVLILQPLAENAIRHGIARHAAIDRIVITARQEGGMLVLEIQNGSSPGITAGGQGLGLGLANTRARLGKLYGDAFSLQLVAPPEGGATARICIPARRIGAEHAA